MLAFFTCGAEVGIPQSQYLLVPMKSGKCQFIRNSEKSTAGRNQPEPPGASEFVSFWLAKSIAGLAMASRSEATSLNTSA
jgi:hypothetical protein